MSYRLSPSGSAPQALPRHAATGWIRRDCAVRAGVCAEMKILQDLRIHYLVPGTSKYYLVPGTGKGAAISRARRFGEISRTEK